MTKAIDKNSSPTQQAEEASDALRAALQENSGEITLARFKTLLSALKVKQAVEIISPQWLGLPHAVRTLLIGHEDWPDNLNTPKRVELQAALSYRIVGVDPHKARSMFIRVAEALADPKAGKQTGKKAALAVLESWLGLDTVNSLPSLELHSLAEAQVKKALGLVGAAYAELPSGNQDRDQIKSSLHTWAQTVRSEATRPEVDRFLARLDEASGTSQPKDPSPRTAAVSQSVFRPTTTPQTLQDPEDLEEAHRKIGKALRDYRRQNEQLLSAIQDHEKRLTRGEQINTELEERVKELTSILRDRDELLAEARKITHDANEHRHQTVAHLHAVQEQVARFEKDAAEARAKLDAAEAAVAAKTAELEQAKQDRKHAVEHAQRGGHIKLAKDLEAKLQHPLSQINEFLNDSPSEAQLNAISAKVRSVINTLRASEINIGE